MTNKSIPSSRVGRNVVIIGTQWGDEGKGKIVDWLTEDVQGVVRFQGGTTLVIPWWSMAKRPSCG